MTGPESSKINAFGQEYKLDCRDRICIQHTLTAEQVQLLEICYPDAPSLQSAVRMACHDGIKDQHDRLLLEEYREMAEKVDTVIDTLEDLE